MIPLVETASAGAAQLHGKA